MNKRDSILVVFRLLAIFILLYAIAKIPDIIWEWTRISTISNVSLVGPIIIHIITRFLLEIVIPLIVVSLLWKKSGWFTNKILAPFGDNENFALSEVEPEQIHHLTQAEIESSAFIVIGVWILISSLPGLVQQIITVFEPRVNIRFLIYMIEPIVKILFGAFLVFRATNLAAWLSKRHEQRIQD